MEFRHEWKQQINRSDIMALESRLSVVTVPDALSANGYYSRCSLEFRSKQDQSNDSDTQLRAINSGERYRFIYFNRDNSVVRLEKTTMDRVVEHEESCEVSWDFVRSIVTHSFSDIVRDPLGRTGDDLDPLIQEFYWKVIAGGLRPETVVEVFRRSYVYDNGSAVINIDRNIRYDQDICRFLAPEGFNGLVFNDSVVVQVRWNHHLPEAIRNVLLIEDKKAGSFY